MFEVWYSFLNFPHRYSHSLAYIKKAHCIEKLISEVLIQPDWYFSNTYRGEDGVIPSEIVSIEKILVVGPQNSWKIKYHSREYWATNLKKTLVSPFTLRMHAFFLFTFSLFKLFPPGGCNLFIYKPVFFHFSACNLPWTDFFNWNRVKLRYCDGASFSGDAEDEVSVRNMDFYE